MANLLTLPDEIKVKIFGYLNGIDKIQLLKVCQDLHRVGVDRNVLKSLNFSKNYKLTLAQLKYIARRQTGFKVTILNLNGVHWITSAELRDTLVRFPNLNALYVLDTQLSFRDLAKTLETTKKVRKLAFSLKSDSCGDVLGIPLCVPITHLYVTYNSYAIRALVNFLTKFYKLEELWMVEPHWPIKIKLQEETPWLLWVENSLPKVTKKIVLKRHCTSFPGGEAFLNELKCPNGNWKTFLILTEKSNNTFFIVLENEVEKICKVRTNITQMPNSGVDNVHVCITEQKILCSSIIRPIRKFKCDSKVFWDSPEGPQAPEETTSFKKRCIDLPSQQVDEYSKFAKFAQNATEMEEFELIDLHVVGAQDQLWTINNLSLARNWKILKKLIITSVNMYSGKFLIDITKHCLLLRSLKIQDDLVEDNISSSLCEALQYALNLKDFRYERKGGVPVDLLLESLTKCYQLERLYIQCRYTYRISNKLVETLITRCENLMFLFLFITEVDDSFCKIMKEHINKFVRPGQIINIRGETYHLPNIMYEDIPYCHVEEIVCQESDPNCEYLNNFFE